MSFYYYSMSRRFEIKLLKLYIACNTISYLLNFALVYQSFFLFTSHFLISNMKIFVSWKYCKIDTVCWLNLYILYFFASSIKIFIHGFKGQFYFRSSLVAFEAKLIQFVYPIFINGIKTFVSGLGGRLYFLFYLVILKVKIIAELR